MEKIKNLINVFSKNNESAKTTKLGISLAFSTSKWDFLLMIAVGLIKTLISLADIYFISSFFSHIETCIEVGSIDAKLFILLALNALCIFASSFHSTWYQRFYVQFISITAFERKLKIKLHEKCMRISNENFEAPEIYAYARQARNASVNIYRLTEIVIVIALAVLNAIAVTCYISTFNSWYVIFIIMAIIPSVIEFAFSTKQWEKSHAHITQLKHEERAYEDAMVSPESFKETRAFGSGEFILSKWNKSREEHETIEYGIEKKLFLLRNALSILQIIGENAGIILSVLLLIKGQIGIGEFSAGISAYSSLMTTYSILFEDFSYYHQFAKMVQPFFRFIELPERKAQKNYAESGIDSVLPDLKVHDFTTNDWAVKLTNVSFKYPNGEKNALENVSLTVKQGEILAIVGENGAGKTTLINILMGLYLPTQGSVHFSGRDVCEITESELHNNHSAVCQKYVRYNMTLRDNIVTCGGADDKLVQALIDELFEKSEGVSLDLMLGKDFGGTELSGGQWQKLALARGFYKTQLSLAENGILALDEPTGAIDPLKEKFIYDMFQRNVRGKTGIVVTHRLGSILIADKIIVLDNGKIVESGTHEELLKLNGKYSRLWNSQAMLFN